MKRNAIFYWIFTVLLCLWMLVQGVLFITNTATIEPLFEGLGFPVWLIMPLGVAKILAVVAILYGRPQLLKVAAYAGLGLDFIVALVSHFIAADGQWMGAAIALVLLGGSWWFNGKR